ncbi:MAG: hypothetical protein IJY42_05010 [Clostridia bacterium]|nr:hypothetical protein [Clostridia bacterium]
MGKVNYFEQLEAMSRLMLEGVKAVDKKEPLPLGEGERLLCSCELALFSDFLPPLERHSIAMMAHALLLILREAELLRSVVTPQGLRGQAKEEYEQCLSMCQQLDTELRLLRTVRKPRAVPELGAFRQWQSQAEAAHRGMLHQLSAGALPRTASELAHRLEQLRHSIAEAFDRLVEVMLINI